MVRASRMLAGLFWEWSCRVGPGVGWRCGEYQGSVVREGLHFGECPRWHDGRLWYSDFFDHAVHALAPGGSDKRVVEVAAQPGGLGGCRMDRC
jgi:hypothetical protein